MSDSKDASAVPAAGFSFTLNGEPVLAEGLSPSVTLLQWLRATGRVGSKEGCAEGDCGACTVALSDRDAAGRPAWRAVNSCLVLLPMVAGRAVKTAEGLASGDGALHPAQREMVACHGSQCGYCTPGFVVSMWEGCQRADLREAWQAQDQIAGNLCRCTGYRPVRDALGRALAAGTAPEIPPAPISSALDYAAPGERFLRPASLPALLDAMARHPQARLVAGATELALLVTKKFQRIPALISVEAVPELATLRATPAGLEIGGAVTLTRLDEFLAPRPPDDPSAWVDDSRPSALQRTLWTFGSRQIRSRATVAGNLVTASPIGDLAPLFLALDATLVLASAAGTRELPLAEFFLGYRSTALRAGEVLLAVKVPRPAPGRRWFDAAKVSRRREMDISTVAGAWCVVLDPAGRVTHARIAYGGVAERPRRALRAEAALLGKEWTLEAVRAVRTVLDTEFTPISDVRGSAEYRAGLIGDLWERFFHTTQDTAAVTSCVEAFDHSPVPAPDPWPGHAEWPAPHESAVGHVTGRARYVDDQAPKRGMLETWPVQSPHAHARVLSRCAAKARAMPGIHAVLLAEDVPGLNDSGPVRHDEPLLAHDLVQFHGQTVALVVGETVEQCRIAAALVEVEYEPLPPVLDLREAIARGDFHTEPHTLRRGDAPAELARARDDGGIHIAGEFHFGGQEHFYLETQCAWAEPGEEPDELFVHSSTQHPSEIQSTIAHVLRWPRHRITVQSPRVGGGFGGKETQGNAPAALAALAACATGRPARVWFNRDQDMALTGKRHPFLARWEAAVAPDGRMRAVRAELFSDGGWSLDLSQAICDRALFHLDNAYYLPHVEFTGRVAKTNVASNTAFRGFGGPQGMLVIEEILDHAARACGLPPEDLRAKNLYRGDGDTNTTHYGQPIGDQRIRRIWDELLASSDFTRRRAEITEWNARSPHVKRGLAITPVKFGISFTLRHLNQAGALALVYQDGSVLLNHGGTEMGQGLHTKILAVAERELGVPRDLLRITATRTDKVPNTSPTAASCGSDLNGAAVAHACQKLRSRLAPLACRWLDQDEARAPDVRFESGRVFLADDPAKSLPWASLIGRAYIERVPLSATGHYATPGLDWDWSTARGRPFHYFACGAAVSEAAVCGFTGAARLLRTDILHDVGDSLAAGVDRGQIEGGFVQGLGWLTVEELKWDAAGRLLTHSPDTYKIPAVGDAPADFRVAFLRDAHQPGVIGGSKAVGEPPLMLAISAREAIRDAVSAFAPAGNCRPVELASPATGEAVWRAVRRMKQT